MSNLINIDAESQADMIGDDAQPTLRLRNTSTGPGLHSEGLAVSSGASVDLFYGQKAFASSATVGVANIGGPILAAAATISNLNLYGASRASGALFALKGDAFVSCTTILFTTGATSGTGAIRVVLTDGTFGWIPVLPGGTVTPVAI